MNDSDKLWRIVSLRDWNGSIITHTTWRATDEGKDEYVKHIQNGRGKIVSVTQLQVVSEEKPMKRIEKPRTINKAGKLDVLPRTVLPKSNQEKIKLEKAKTALRIIQTWANCDDMSKQSRKQAMSDIADKCKQTLNELENKVSDDK